MPGPINSVPSVEVEHFSDGPPLGKIAPEGLTSAAPSLPAQAWTDGRAAESRSGTSSALHEVFSASGVAKSVGATFAMVAGEASGDLLAGLLLDGLKARWPALVSGGIGGPQMAARGFQAWWPSDKLAVRGYVEVLRHYREIVGIREQLKTRLLDQGPDIFIGVDAPDFNLDLEAGLKAAGIKTVHFVCPSVWAWRAD